MAKITFEDKVSLNPQPSIADKNKVSDANMNEIKTCVNDNCTYSTSEICIGEWIDGKPLYRKVFNITNPSETNTDYIDLTSYNMNVVAHLYGFYKTGAGTFEIPFTDSDNNYSVMFVSGSKKLRGRFGTNAPYVTEVKVVIEYTKTTD
jgi:hypothetical protein